MTEQETQTAGKKERTKEECLKAYDLVALAKQQFPARLPGEFMSTSKAEPDKEDSEEDQEMAIKGMVHLT